MTGRSNIHREDAEKTESPLWRVWLVDWIPGVLGSGSQPALATHILIILLNPPQDIVYALSLVLCFTGRRFLEQLLSCLQTDDRYISHYKLKKMALQSFTVDLLRISSLPKRLAKLIFKGCQRGSQPASDFFLNLHERNMQLFIVVETPGKNLQASQVHHVLVSLSVMTPLCLKFYL